MHALLLHDALTRSLYSLSSAIISRLVQPFRAFVADTTARTAAALCGVTRKTTRCYGHRLREIVMLELEAEGGALFGGNRKGVEDEGRGENTSIWLTQAWQEGLHEDHFRWVAGNFVSDHGAQDCA